MEKEEYIKSPINYTGNKYRILKQILPYIPKNVDIFVDLFSGGATVGFNVKANKIIMIDFNEKVIDLLKVLANYDINKIINQIEEYINEYNLSYSYKLGYKYYKELGYVEKNNGLKNYNKLGFEKLKKTYNNLKDKKNFKANIMLYLLILYGFNNDIRFNSKGEFNLPIGKTDFNKNNYNKIVKFNERAKKINFEFICADFREKNIFEKILSKASFIYCDPPYLITKAVYNENNSWTEKEEKDLLNILDKINSNGINFALSNVLKKQDVENSILIKWLNENNYKKINIDYHYKSSSYNKKNRNSNEEEVLILNAK